MSRNPMLYASMFLVGLVLLALLVVEVRYRSSVLRRHHDAERRASRRAVLQAEQREQDQLYSHGLWGA